MESVTLTFAAAAGALVFFLPPVYGLIVYVAALVWYPSYLTVTVGTVDFTAHRIIILAIFSKLFLLTSLPGRFKFVWLDRLVIIYFIAQIVSNSFVDSMIKLLENRAGLAFDTVLPYFAVRMIIKNKKQYLTMLKGILIVVAPLAIVGFYQCLTGYNPAGFLIEYHGWSDLRSEGYVALTRKGFFRANVTFNISILFGLVFAMFGPVCAGLLGIEKRYRKLYWVALFLMGIGVFSSMSSGPMLAALLAIVFISCYRYRRYWKVITAVVVLMCGSVEIISNRHFYDVLGSYTIVPGTAWYRSRLIEVALFEGGMSGHWLTGFGYDVDPGWCRNIDGRSRTDVVNHYLLVLCRFGLVGFLPFLAMNIVAIKQLVGTYKASVLRSDKWLIWCLGAGLFALAGAFMTICVFGPPNSVYYLMIGFVGVMPAIIIGTGRQDFVKSELGRVRKSNNQACCFVNT
jgi:hypothetical protein